MIEINGEKGGGQMLRTALSLSAITGKDFRIQNIRGNRSDPGLKRQHLECFNAAKRLCSAEVDGAETGSEELVFRPSDLQAESFTSNIGTAGSVTLLFDTVLPIATKFEDSFRFTAKGGTDVKWSPTFAYFSEVKIPLLRKFGLKADADLEETGYYPKGGGEATLRTENFSLHPIELTDRGELERFQVFSKASRDLESQDVADRQADEAARLLKNEHVSTPIDKDIGYEETGSTGSSLLIKAVYENSVAGFDALGERGKRSEDVARDAFQDFRDFHSSGAVVDEYMADQLMVLIALSGGKVSITEATEHVETNLEVIQAFGFDIELDRKEKMISG
jgi:RNA 3'-terminal phosphate cyclase (ATP)